MSNVLCLPLFLFYIYGIMTILICSRVTDSAPGSARVG